MASPSPHVLIVEDNLLIAMDVQYHVESCGCVAVGPAATVGEALKMIGDGPLAGAILDVNLNGERVWPVVDVLESCHVPFVLASGYGVSDIPPAFKDRPRLTKPVTTDDVRRALEAIGVIRSAA